LILLGQGQDNALLRNNNRLPISNGRTIFLSSLVALMTDVFNLGKKKTLVT